jgi:RNase adapter protein RapZ
MANMSKPADCNMRLIVISGMSGAGKATAAKAFEDMSYLVVDNLPPILLPELIEKCIGVGNQAPAELLAVVVDTRSGTFFQGWQPALDLVRRHGVKPTVLFLDAADTVLVQRFKETRRRHPLFDEQGGIPASLRIERDLLEGLRESADKVIDTTDMDPTSLRHLLIAEFAPSLDRNEGLTVTVASFGFKFGMPLDADLVFDVRFLINPHYVDDLRPFDGRDQQVTDYVMRDPDTGLFLTKLFDLMDFSMPQYVHEGKAYLTVAIGCTGGRHRSVVVAEKLGEFLRTKGYRVLIQHRDVEK